MGKSTNEYSVQFYRADIEVSRSATSRMCPRLEPEVSRAGKMVYYLQEGNSASQDRALLARKLRSEDVSRQVEKD